MGKMLSRSREERLPGKPSLTHFCCSDDLNGDDLNGDRAKHDIVGTCNALEEPHCELIVICLQVNPQLHRVFT